MINLRRLFKDYCESGALHALIGVQAAIGDGVFVTKAGDLMMLLALHGNGQECLDPAETDHIARRFESVLRTFDERFRLYQYVAKCQNPTLPFEHHAHAVVEEAITNRMNFLDAKVEPLYSFETYLAVVYEGWRPRPGSLGQFAGSVKHSAVGIRQALSTGKTIQSLDEELEAARELLANKVASFVIQCRDFAPVRELDDQEAFRFLRHLLNYTTFKADGVRLAYPNFVDYQACGSALECHRDYLRLDDWYVQVLTLKEPPARTFANMLRGLLDIPSNYLIASEWKRQSPLDVRRFIQSKRRHFHNSKASFLNYLHSTQPAAQETLIDDGAAALVANLGACLEEIEVHGRSFGEFSLTIVLYSQDLVSLRRSVAQCFKVFAVQDAQLMEERYNRLNAWLAALPGNSAYNLRHLWLSNTNYADLSFLATPSNGSARNEHLGTEYLALLEGTGGAPYFFNLHDKDVAHTLVLGATGSGKSFLLNFIVTHLQKYLPFTCIFDLGGSYENLTRLFGGSYFPVGVEERPFTINPFCLPPTKENLLFLFAFVKVLIESNGYQLTAEDERDLFEQIENLYSVAPDQRRLFTLANIVHRNLRGPLQKWVQGGPYAGLFDNVQDTLTLARFQTFDFEGMDKAIDQCEPLLFYVLHRANAVLSDPNHASVFKVFVMDEAWRFFRHPVIKAYIVEALKTWRKKNAAMILATQSGGDLLASDMLSTIVESCPTKLFLANPGMNQDTYRSAFHLNQTEAAMIANLVPKQQMLLKQPGVSKVLNLHVDRKGYWLYTNNPQDNARKREAFERYGFHKGLEVLASQSIPGQPIGGQPIRSEPIGSKAVTSNP